MATVKINELSAGTITDSQLLFSGNPSTGALGKITGSDLKTYIGAAPLMYVAVISQSGTGAPTASVALNTLGTTLTWARSNTGQYTATAGASIFVNGKTVAFATNGSPNNGISCLRFSATVINVESGTFSTPADSAITGASFKIEIYP